MWSVGNQRFFLGIANGIPGISKKVYLSIIRYLRIHNKATKSVCRFIRFLLFQPFAIERFLMRKSATVMETVYSTSCRLNHSFEQVPCDEENFITCQSALWTRSHVISNKGRIMRKRFKTSKRRWMSSMWWNSLQDFRSHISFHHKRVRINVKATFPWAQMVE